MTNLVLDRATGRMVDVDKTQDFLLAQIYANKTKTLRRMAGDGKARGNLDLAKRTQLGDLLITGDSGGDFGVYLTEVFDPLVNMPIWSVDYKENITVMQAPFGAEATSWVNAQIFGSSSKDPQGIHWAADQQTAIPRQSAEFAKSPVLLAPWGEQASFSIWEIARAQMNGLPLETTVLEAIGTQFALDTNIIAHLGSVALGGYGLLNQPGVTPVTASTKAKTGTRWVINGALNATPQEILQDVLNLETAVHNASGQNRVFADTLLIDWVSLAALNQPMTVGGYPVSLSILEYIAEHSFCYSNTGKKLAIRGNKFLLGTTAATENGLTVPMNASGTTQGNAGAATRAAAYVNDPKYVRMYVTNPAAQQVQYVGFNYNIPYAGQLPQGVEYRYSNTIAYLTAN